MKIKFSDPRKILTIKLPSWEGAEVEVYNSLLMGDNESIIGKYQDNDFGMSLEIAFKSIKSWNFTDENGADLPLTKENFVKLPDKDVLYIIEQINASKLDKKKE